MDPNSRFKDSPSRTNGDKPASVPPRIETGADTHSDGADHSESDISTLQATTRAAESDRQEHIVTQRQQVGQVKSEWVDLETNILAQARREGGVKSMLELLRDRPAIVHNIAK